MSEAKYSWIRASLVGALVLSPVAVPAALAQAGAEAIEEVVVTGSRRPGRTATESTVPVDVFDGNDFQAQGSSDMNELLRNLVPSYNVSRLPISDAASISRPATLRGLPPDNTLLLVNGKRWHRGAVIAELGGSLAAGSQGPDTYSIPAIAVKQVEVLRDGAAAQYGSDAIAGVINYQLKDDREGMTFEAKYGETFEGDGEAMQFAGNVGLPLGENGFANVSLQWRDNEDTSRSVQRIDAAGLIATGNTAVANPAQPWGSPKVEDDYSFFVNSGIQLTDTQELYAFGHYAEREQSNGFFFRNPNNRNLVFTGDRGGPDNLRRRAIMDTNIPAGATGVTSNCPAQFAAGDATFGGYNPSTLPANCFVFNGSFPGGFTPTFGAELEDISGLVGLRGEFANGVLYDFSTRMARNEVGFYLDNTINPSMGPASPTYFDSGKYLQTEQNYNADFSLPVAVDAFHSPLNVAWGLEYRVETFEIRGGDQASWLEGPYATQNGTAAAPNFYADGVTQMVPMAVGANGFAGFSPNQTGEFDRANYAAYVDLETDVIEQWTVGVAFRYEDFDDFGTTSNGKVSTRYQFVDNFAMRASASTGFRAPTPGQSNVEKVSTRTVAGVLQQAGQVPPTSPIALLKGGGQLDAEEATNWSIGFAWDPLDDLTITLDYFNIEVTDRISNTGLLAITPAERAALEAAGSPLPLDLESVDFYVNDFDTTTSGVDLVATYAYDWGDFGSTGVSLAWNWTETEVDEASAIISRDRIIELENYNPENRGILTINHSVGDFGVLVRTSYYDDWVEAGNGGPSSVSCSTAPGVGDRCGDGTVLVDLELSYTLQSRYTFVLGGQNVFDEYPDEDPDGPGSGNEYLTSSPWGFDGGLWYARFRVDLD